MLDEERVGGWRKKRGCYPLGKGTVRHGKGKSECIIRPPTLPTGWANSSLIGKCHCHRGLHTGAVCRNIAVELLEGGQQYISGIMKTC